MELLVTNSPFTQEQVELLNRLLPTLTDSQRIWLNGYLAALQGTGGQAASGTAALNTAGTPADLLSGAASAVPASPAVPKEATVLFGSQTGNSQGLAKKLAQKLEQQGFAVTLSSMSDFKTNTLKKLHYLFVVVSTQGEGDPPDNAISFHSFLNSKRAPELSGLSYSVLALGDTSYEYFCKTGKDFDERFEQLGARRLVPRTDCDVDFDESAAEWMNRVLESVSQTAAPAVSVSPSEAGSASSAEVQSEYSRTNPFPAEVLENLNLNGRGASKETRHLELSLESSNLTYEPGDSLGIYPENHPQLVDDLIEAMGWNPEETVALDKKGQTGPLREALLRHYEITVLTKPLLEQASKLVPDSTLKELLAAGHKQELRDYLKGRDLLDLIQDYSLKGIPAGDFVGILRKLPARLYSISSSPSANPDEVHVTVRAVRYERGGRQRYGVCSVHLADRIQPGDSLPVFIQQNPNFKLPADPDAPLIMVGPGTGVAPFRSFLGEREEQGAAGRTWLFFGDQHFATDFLYQVEWQRWLKDGVLTRMDVAFSRDKDQKVYVQHRMLERGAELYKWIQDGAYIYVCGDEKYMAQDVHQALQSILVQQGGLSPEAAAEYLTGLQQQKRYQRDVY
ncbi:assimilatory sulfite reductase (NADPH) flavoprotein subunit [Paenibacillus physcomitrellae]|uniref:Sulfite reductase [NADPH] flavoprotein alpha-component n=1 Tax=Paenibacillus physcomitrellae TaxID=1619311 RepID=A0ABQ1GPB7_9BACL|nr:assimilatory sulfite reductase (NADPH) flavoprotein subunit [Paenibacillus physcomitrellae]GGA47804.1 sulfite reductase [NADPH] flavoprotein alpha-component [Paenibacillus physcomitrellae]